MGPVTEPEAARALLDARDRVSVVHPSGARWVVLHGILQVVTVLLLLGTVADLAGWWGDGSSRVPILVAVLAVAVVTAPFWVQLTKAVPRRRDLRLRAPWVGTVLRGGRPEEPPAAWPEEGHGYAVLAVAARTNGIDRAWLFERAAVAPALGDATVRELAAQGWVEGGHRWLGSDRLSVPVTVTRAGRRALAVEHRRLEALALPA